MMIGEGLDLGAVRDAPLPLFVDFVDGATGEPGIGLVSLGDAEEEDPPDCLLLLPC